MTQPNVAELLAEHKALPSPENLDAYRKLALSLAAGNYAPSEKARQQSLAVLAALGLTPADLQAEVDRLMFLRSLEADQSVEDAQQHRDRCTAALEAHEQELVELTARLAVATAEGADKRLAVLHANDVVNAVKANRKAQRTSAVEIEALLRSRGFTDLPALTPEQPPVRVQALEKVYSDDVMREPGEVFLIPADQFKAGGPVQIVGDNVALGRHPLRRRYRCLRKFLDMHHCADSRDGIWRMPGDVFEIHGPKVHGEFLELAGDDVPLGKAELPPEDRHLPLPEPDPVPQPVFTDPEDQQQLDDDEVQQ